MAFFRDGIGFVACDTAKLEQMFKVTFAHRLASLNGPVERRLSERRFVALIMAESPIAEHIDENIPAEFAPEIHRQPDNLRNGFRVFAIYEEHRRLNHFGDVR